MEQTIYVQAKPGGLMSSVELVEWEVMHSLKTVYWLHC